MLHYKRWGVTNNYQTEPVAQNLKKYISILNLTYLSHSFFKILCVIIFTFLQKNVRNWNSLMVIVSRAAISIINNSPNYKSPIIFHLLLDIIKGPKTTSRSQERKSKYKTFHNKTSPKIHIHPQNHVDLGLIILLIPTNSCNHAWYCYKCSYIYLHFQDYLLTWLAVPWYCDNGSNQKFSTVMIYPKHPNPSSDCVCEWLEI